MRIVFMGTPDFAVPSLTALASHHEVCAVVTRPDAASKRGKGLYPSAVKQRARELGLSEDRILCTKSLRSDEIQQWLRSWDAELFVVAAYSALLPQEVLKLPRLGCINVHASLLPRWRGAAPIQRALLANDSELGVCIMRMEEGLDTGDWCLAASVPSADKYADELMDELGNLGAKLLIQALSQLETSSLCWHQQDEKQASYADKLLKYECFLSPQLSAHDNFLRLRASSDSSPARLLLAAKGVRIYRARVLDSVEQAFLRTELPLVGSMKAGEGIADKRRLFLMCKDQSLLEVFSLKADGKAILDAQAFIQGLKKFEPLPWSEL